MNMEDSLFGITGPGRGTILIVDDDPSNLANLSDYLKDGGFEVLAAEEGRLGFERARLTTPDLILLDILMPKMDGFETCRLLKADETTRDIPVIFMTVLADKDSKVKGFDVGAVDYIPKPASRGEVLARVGVHLGIRQLTRSLQQAKASLEIRVEQRTADLANANRILEAQMDQRRHAEEELQKSEARFRLLYEHNPTMYFTLNEQGMVLSANLFGAEQLGYAVEELVGQPVLNVFHPDDKEAAQQQLEDLLGKPGKLSSWELRKIRKDGSGLWVKETARCIQGGDGQPLILSVCENITARKEAEQALEESKEFLDKIINSIAEPIFVKDRNNCWVLLNDACSRFIGLPMNQLIGKRDHEIFSKDEADIFLEKDEIVFATGQENINQERLTDAQGVVHTIVTTKTLYEDDKGEMFIVGIINDITERKELEAQLQQAHKMESMGILAGGIAHDFNNILTPILVGCEAALKDIPEEGPLRKTIQRIFGAGYRAKDLVKQILAFNRQTDGEVTVFAVAPVIKEVIALMQSSLPATIEIQHDIKASSSAIVADPTLIHRVLMNLCTNAAHAMHRNGGVLRLSLQQIDVDKDAAAKYTPIESGCYVKLTVTDTGHGMDSDTMKKIFDPFFTTKTREEGTGMGLSVVHGIVKSLGGAIAVTSEPGKGSAFEVLLPECKPEPPAGTRIVELPPSGSESILFVDDDEALCDMMGDLLKRLGYEVVIGTNGIEALEILRDHPGKFDIIITDQTMPKMTGKELCEKLKVTHPNLPVILCTGFSDSIDKDSAKTMGIRAFMMKPISMHELALTIRKVLDEGHGALRSDNLGAKLSYRSEHCEGAHSLSN